MSWSLSSPEVRRNAGFMSAEHQQKLLDAKVSVAGNGGEGYHFATLLARMGVQTFRLADPDSFDVENVNRVPGANVHTLGMNKAAALAGEILSINPDAKIEVYKDGVTLDSMEEFVGGSDLVFDGIDLFHPDLSTALHREAWARRIPSMTSLNIGRAAVVTSFLCGESASYEEFIGLPKGVPIDEIRDVSTINTVPHLPVYEDMEVLRRVENGKMPLPSLATGVALATSLAADQAERHISGGFTSSPVWAKKYIYVDMGGNTPEAGIVRFPRIHTLSCLAKLAIRGCLGLNRRSGGYGDMLDE